MGIAAALGVLLQQAAAAPPDRYRERERERRGPEFHERGHVVHELPPGCRLVEVRGVKYYERGGVYFQPAAGGYVIVDAPEGGIVVTPAVGSVIATLPIGAVTVTIGGKVFYRHGNVFYRPQEGRYVVVERPPTAVVVESQPAVPVAVSLAPASATTYTSVWAGSQEYLFRGGVFYRQFPDGLRAVEAPIGVTLSAPPPGSLDMWIGDNEYFYFQSTFYQKRPAGYEVAPPPPNAYIRALPKSAKTVWTAGRRLFYVGGSYYEQRDQGYLVTAPPVVLTAPSIPLGMLVPAPPEGNIELWVNDVEYQYHAGNFYRKQPTGFLLVPNPLN